MKIKKFGFVINDYDFKERKKILLVVEKLEGVEKIKINSAGVVRVRYDSDQITPQDIQRETRRITGSQLSNLIPLVRYFPPSLGLFSITLNIILLLMLSKLIFANGAQVFGVSTQKSQSPSSSVTTQSFEIKESDHLRGNKDAKVTLVEFSDFECPYCTKHEPTLKQLLTDYDGKIRLVYKHNPLPMHKNAVKAAEGSECAGEQGRFWEYHDKLFDQAGKNLSLDLFKSLAKDLGLDTAQFNSCLDSGKYSNKVTENAKEAASKAVKGVPATFINGKLFSGAQPIEALKAEIEAQLKK